MGLEECFNEFINLPLEEKEKQGPTLARKFFKTLEEFRYTVRNLIKDTDSYETLYKIVNECGRLAVYAGQNVHWALNYMLIRKAKLGEPKNPTEMSYRTLIEMQFSWVQKEHTPYNPNPMQAYTRH
jgi:hypothetical protein